METITYIIDIKAPAEVIWKILWDHVTYSQWTKFFGSEDSQYRSDWQVGGRTYFVDGSGNNGMVSTIESLNPPYEVVFKHLGELKDGQEITDTKDVMEWSGAQEKYFLTELDGYTKLQAETQTVHQYADMMREGFAKGFEVVKQLAEGAQ